MNFPLAILDEPFQIAHGDLLLRFQEVSIHSHGYRHVGMSEIPGYFGNLPAQFLPNKISIEA
jgi:hypothetical protein